MEACLNCAKLQERVKSAQKDCDDCYSDRGKIYHKMIAANALIDECEAALEYMYKTASPYLPCEDAWEPEDPLVKMISKSRVILAKLKAHKNNEIKETK